MNSLQQTTVTTTPELSEDSWELARRLGFLIFPLVACASLDRRPARLTDLIRTAGLSSKRRSIAVQALGLALSWLRVRDLVRADFVVVD